MTVGLLSIANPVVVSGLVFNLIYDPSWSSAPAAYQSGSTSIVQACSLISTAFPHVNATLNLHVGYGDQWQSPTFTNAIAASSSAGNPIGFASQISYSTIRTAMANLAFKSTSLTQLLSNTPAGSSLNGTSAFDVPSSVCKAIGLFGFSGGPTSATDASIVDGSIGIGSGWSSAKLLGMFLHEISHALGRVTTYAPFEWSRFTAAGTRDFTTGSPAAYFSLDGGTTPLATYDNSSDVSDFLNPPDTGTAVQDPLDCFGAFQQNGGNQFLSTLDIQLMNALGFQ